MKRTLLGASIMALSSAAFGSQAALDKLQACLELPAASKEQDACVAEVKRIGASEPRSAAPAAAPKPKSKAAAAPPPPVPAEVKTAAADVGLNGMQPKTAAMPAGGRMPVRDISGMDLESAMLAVQSRRAELTESQLKAQLEAVAARNKEVAQLNALLARIRAQRPAGSDTYQFASLAPSQAEARTVYASLKAAGVTMPGGGDTVDENGNNGIYDARQKTFDAWTREIQAKIDAHATSQQMEMLRLQALSSKRNEAFDLMTHFIKKMQDGRSSIVGNMR